MANLLIPWQRYLSDVAHKYVGYPDEEGGDMIVYVDITQEGGSLSASMSASEILEELSSGNAVLAKIQNGTNFVYLYPGIITTEPDTSVQFITFLSIIDGNAVTNLSISVFSINDDNTVATADASISLTSSE